MVTHLINLWDFSKDRLTSYLNRALEFKHEAREGVQHKQLSGKTLSLIFEKPSTRTRVSFEAAMYSLGGQVIYLSGRETQLARDEPLKDMARVMARYVDALVIRTFRQETVEELARYSSIPVINGLTDKFHPCQILSDMMTIVEYKGELEKLKIAWVGDGNNMANSWIQAAGRMGFELTLACPRGYGPDPAVLAEAQKEAEKPITVVRDPRTAIMDADVVNCDVWASMGQESEKEERYKIFHPYQVNQQLLNSAKPGITVLHCLPAHREEEITEEVLESPSCPAFDQAENKMHMHKAILEQHLFT